MFDKHQKELTVRYSWLFIAALGLLVTLAACGEEPTVNPLDIGDPERGREIFETGGGRLETGCIVCHSLDGSENAGPTLLGISALAGERVTDLSAVEYIRQSIVDPNAYEVEGFPLIMPLFLQAVLGEEEINNLVAFLLTQ